MAFSVIEENIIRVLRNDSGVISILVSNIPKKVFSKVLRPQKVGFPNISVDISYGPEEAALPAILGTAIIMMEFEELKSDGIPIEFLDMSILKEHILDALSKVDFGLGRVGSFSSAFSSAYSKVIPGLILNQFLLLGSSEPFFDLEDKVWRWPLIFEFVHRDKPTVGRVGVEVP